MRNNSHCVATEYPHNIPKKVDITIGIINILILQAKKQKFGKIK